MLRLITAVEATKVPGGKKTDQECSRAERSDVSGVPQGKIANTAKKQIADDDV
ncbi:hypothetical protein QNM99_22260 [Pseudomonas sp. PCH446]